MRISFYIFQLRDFECEQTLFKSAGPFNSKEEAEEALKLIISNNPPANRIDEELNYTILPVYTDQKPNKDLKETTDTRIERIRAYSQQAQKNTEVWAISYLLDVLDSLETKTIPTEKRSLISSIEKRIKEIQAAGDNLDDMSWKYELGVLFSGTDALSIIRELKHTPNTTKKQEENLTRFLDAVEGLVGICNRTGQTYESLVWQQKVGKVMVLFQNFRIQKIWK